MKTDQLPGIPFDASKPEDLARLKAGWPLVQRDGAPFNGRFIAVDDAAEKDDQKLVFRTRKNGFLTYSKQGQHRASIQTDDDLFFAANKTRKSKWVAVVLVNGRSAVMSRDTKEEIESDATNGKLPILSGPVELSWEEDAPLPPVEQPKAGWYVGPYATQEIAVSNTHRTPVYGTLTEVQL